MDTDTTESHDNHAYVSHMNDHLQTRGLWDVDIVSISGDVAYLWYQISSVAICIYMLYLQAMYAYHKTDAHTHITLNPCMRKTSGIHTDLPARPNKPITY